MCQSDEVEVIPKPRLIHFQMKILHTYSVLAIFLVCILPANAQVKVQGSPSTPQGRLTLIDEKKSQSSGTFEILKRMKDEDVFIDIDGRDCLRWKPLREYLAIVNVDIPMRAEIDVGQRDGVQETANAFRLKKTMQAYLKNAMYASAAMKAGVVVEKEEFEDLRRKTREYQKTRGDAGRKFLELMDASESFYEHNLTNLLYAQAYAEKVLKPKFKVSEEEIAERITYQNNLNADVLATNAFKKALLKDILRKVRNGFDFGEAAEKWSDCPTFDTKGVFTDVDEKPQQIYAGALHPALEEVYKKLSPGEISDIVETPYSWHVLKLLKRHLPKDGEDSSVELAHIMLEKSLLQPILTKEQAKQRILNRHVRIELKKQLPVLFKESKINCKIPIFDKKRSGKKSKTPHESKQEKKQ